MHIEDLKSGDFFSFEALYTLWSKRVYRYAFKKCQSSYISEEVVQQVFIKIWLTRDKLRTDIPIEAQLFQITRSKLIDELRKQALIREIQHQLEKKSENLYHLPEWEEKETLIKIKEVIDAMPPMRKAVFQMSRFEYLTYAEIAERLSISPRTVENHIASALKVLRRHLPLSLLYALFLQ